MKIDFYAPKNYYGSHIMACLGYMCLFVLLWLQSGDGNTLAFIGVPIFIIFILVPIPFYLFGWLFKFKVKSKFILENKVYDFFFDLGCVFYLLPFFSFSLMNDRLRVRALLILLILFLAIRTLKFTQRRREKRETEIESKEQTAQN